MNFLIIYAYQAGTDVNDLDEQRFAFNLYPLPENFNEEEIPSMVESHIPEYLDRDEFQGWCTPDRSSLSTEAVRRMLVEFAIEKKKEFWWIISEDNGCLYTGEIEHQCKQRTAPAYLMDEMVKERGLLWKDDLE